jgi:Na+/citrate or Na+/malate symporter
MVEKSGLLFVMDTQQTECASILMTTICMSEIAAIIYASLLKKWSLMEAKLNLSINPNRQKTRTKTEKNSDKEVQE